MGVGGCCRLETEVGAWGLMLSSCSAGGTDVGCECAEFGCGEGAGVAGDSTEATGIEESPPKEFREYVEAPPCGVP